MSSGSSVDSNSVISSSSSSSAFHFIHPPSPGSPYVSSPEPVFDDAPQALPHWGWEDGLPIDEVDWDFDAMDTDGESDAGSDGSYKLSGSDDERVSWVPAGEEDEDGEDEVNSALIVSDEDEATPEWARRGSSSEDEDEEQPQNSDAPPEDSMDTGGGDSDGGDGSDGHGGH